MRRLALLATLLATSPSLSEAPTGPREARIDAGLRAARDAAVVWHWSWVGTFTALTAAQGVLVGVAESDEQRWVQGVGGSAPVVGLSLQLGAPLAALSLDADLEALEATWGEGRHVERAAAKRRLLRRYARSEAEQRNWFAHVGPLVLNLSVAAVSGFVFDDWTSAGIQLGAGVLISEIKVWTAPTAASESDRELDVSAPSNGPPAVTVVPVLGVGYVGLGGRF